MIILRFVSSFLVLLASVFSSSAQSSLAKIETPLGDIIIQLHDLTPNHRDSFIQLAEAGYWDSLTFNRVIPDFVAQGGCPDTEEGFKDPEYLLDPEFHPDLTHIYGAVGAGRDDNPGKLSARCQFYIVQNQAGLHRLDGNYTVFGQVISGMDLVDKIVSVERDDADEPLEMISIRVKVIENRD
ncbi:peptidylprolyl isomerase [Pararhodonellum marinum]|uniref:peptidylprolyl isomerase n=1 Tax=Pararhodonellum marinum TaxID=2755358 RepID=UPI0018900471|nr:peptidylprolyl isomerase [Pararhodonellum marinum]